MDGYIPEGGCCSTHASGPTVLVLVLTSMLLLFSETVLVVGSSKLPVVVKLR